MTYIPIVVIVPLFGMALGRTVYFQSWMLQGLLMMPISIIVGLAYAVYNMEEVEE